MQTNQTLTDGKGHTLTSPLSTAQAIQICIGLQNDFAKSLASKAKKFPPSPAQTYWLHKLALDNQPAAPAGTPAAIPAPTEETLALGDGAQIIALFKNAADHLQYPEIHLQAENGMPVAFKLSTKTGMVNVSNGKKFGSPDNRWYGRIDLQGVFHVGPKGCPDPVLEVVMALGEDPAGCAARYGKLTGHCCFCKKCLTDPKSTEVGYGPKCASHYMLPWG